MSYLSIPDNVFYALSLAFTLILIVLMAFRWQSDKRLDQGMSGELAQKDNFAFGISYAAYIFTFLTIMGLLFDNLSFVDPLADVLYGLALTGLSFVFVKLGRYIHAKWILRRFDEDEAIENHNVCGALVDSGVVVANGIIVIALYMWTKVNNLNGLLILTVSFFILQFYLLAVSRWQEFVFAKGNQGASLQTSFEFENTSIGLQYAAQNISAALAIYAGIASAQFQEGKLVENSLSLLANCSLSLLLTFFMAGLLTRFALPQIDAESEIDQQDNIGIASIEVAIYIASGLLMVQLFNH